MWPLNLVFLLAMVAPQQNPTDAVQGVQQKPPSVETQRLNNEKRRLTDSVRSNTCFTMRSYFFRRQDGQAPVPAGMTTCTPSSVLQQRRVSPAPRVRFIPLSGQRDEP
jgi:hypothetical protein